MKINNVSEARKMRLACVAFYKVKDKGVENERY